MKTSSTLLAATLLGLAVVSTQAQTQTQTSTTTTSYVQSSKIVGMKVKDSRGEEVGVVKDVVLDRNTGCMAYTVLSTGGGTTRGTATAKTVAVPWTVYTTTSDPSVMVVRVERDRVYNAPAFDYARIDEYSSSGYINNIYSYYGVAPTVGVGAGVSGSTTTGAYGTQTGVAGQAGVAGQTAATAAPGAAASPAATPPTAAASPSANPSASPSATAKARPTASAAASHRGHARPSATAEENTGERNTRERGESSGSPATSSSRESTTSDEGTTEHKASRHHKTTEEETTSESPSSKSRTKEKSEAEPTATP